MSTPRSRSIALSLSVDCMNDTDCQRLIGLLQQSPLAWREGRVGPHIATLVAFWPENADHAEVTRAAERVLNRFGGTLDGKRVGPSSPHQLVSSSVIW